MTHDHFLKMPVNENREAAIKAHLAAGNEFAKLAKDHHGRGQKAPGREAQAAANLHDAAAAAMRVGQTKDGLKHAAAANDAVARHQTKLWPENSPATKKRAKVVG